VAAYSNRVIIEGSAEDGLVVEVVNFDGWFVEVARGFAGAVLIERLVGFLKASKKVWRFFKNRVII
jgi:hypothetical protein